MHYFEKDKFIKNLLYKLDIVKVIAIIIMQLFLFTNINIKDGFSFSKGQNISPESRFKEEIKKDSFGSDFQLINGELEKVEQKIKTVNNEFQKKDIILEKRNEKPKEIIRKKVSDLKFIKVKKILNNISYISLCSGIVLTFISMLSIILLTGVIGHLSIIFITTTFLGISFILIPYVLALIAFIISIILFIIIGIINISINKNKPKINKQVNLKNNWEKIKYFIFKKEFAFIITTILFEISLLYNCIIIFLILFLSCTLPIMIILSATSFIILFIFTLIYTGFSKYWSKKPKIEIPKKHIQIIKDKFEKKDKQIKINIEKLKKQKTNLEQQIDIAGNFMDLEVIFSELENNIKDKNELNNSIKELDDLAKELKQDTVIKKSLEKGFDDDPIIMECIYRLKQHDEKKTHSKKFYENTIKKNINQLNNIAKELITENIEEIVNSDILVHKKWKNLFIRLKEYKELKVIAKYKKLKLEAKLKKIDEELEKNSNESAKNIKEFNENQGKLEKQKKHFEKILKKSLIKCKYQKEIEIIIKNKKYNAKLLKEKQENLLILNKNLLAEKAMLKKNIAEFSIDFIIQKVLDKSA